MLVTISHPYNIKQLLTGRGCNITLFGLLKGVIFPKWLYFPKACSAEGKYGHERKYNSLQVHRMLYTPCQSITVILDSLGLIFFFFFWGGGGGVHIFFAQKMFLQNFRKRSAPPPPPPKKKKINK